LKANFLFYVIHFLICHDKSAHQGDKWTKEQIWAESLYDPKA